MAWSHRLTEIHERPAQILIDDRFRMTAPVRELPNCAWFCVYCQYDPGPAFWDPAEAKNLDAIEDALVRLWQESGHGFAVYVMRIATRGIREYYVYHGGRAEFSQVCSKLKTRFPAYRVEHEEHEDPDWKRYISCLPSA